jgi:hypothetical protein
MMLMNEYFMDQGFEYIDGEKNLHEYLLSIDGGAKGELTASIYKPGEYYFNAGKISDYLLFNIANMITLGDMLHKAVDDKSIQNIVNMINNTVTKFQTVTEGKMVVTMITIMSMQNRIINKLSIGTIEKDQLTLYNVVLMKTMNARPETACIGKMCIEALDTISRKLDKYNQTCIDYYYRPENHIILH